MIIKSIFRDFLLELCLDSKMAESVGTKNCKYMSVHFILFYFSKHSCVHHVPFASHEFAYQLYVKSGTQTIEKFADVQKAAAADHNMCRALPGLHSFTGCDTVSAFAGKGKISTFKPMQKNRKYQGAFTRLGKEWSVPRNLSSVLQEFTCKLYATRCPSVAVNELRYLLFRAKEGAVESGRFLPCEDSCKLPGWSVAPCS